MSYLGSYAVDDLLTFYVNTHSPSTGGAVDADAAPSYRVYEDETGTPLLTGTMAKLDDANTVGFYSEQITLSAANGFELGKSYAVRVLATVGGVDGITLQTFQMQAKVKVESIAAGAVNAAAIATGAVDADALAADAAAEIADAVWDEARADHVAVGSFGQAGQAVIRQNTAQAGGAATITLDAGASASDNAYNGFYVAIVKGTGAGQLPRAITAYVGSTKVATIDPAWDTQPDATSEFAIFS